MRLLSKGLFKTALLAVAMTVSFLVINRSVSAALDSTKAQIIKNNCVQSQVTIQQIQYNDAATRVNRGQGYESLLSDYINPLNSRAAAAGFNESAAKLTDIASRYQVAIKKFKDDYDIYDDAITHTLRTKCSQQPTVFYDALQKTRLQRAVVGIDVSDIARLITDYKVEVTALGDEAKQ